MYCLFLLCFLLFSYSYSYYPKPFLFWHSVLWRFLHYPLQTNLPAMQEDILATLESKNPSVKEETVRFLTRSFCKSTPASLPKTFLKPTCGSLLKVRGILKIEGWVGEYDTTVWSDGLIAFKLQRYKDYTAFILSLSPFSALFSSRSGNLTLINITCLKPNFMSDKSVTS